MPNSGQNAEYYCLSQMISLIILVISVNIIDAT